MEEKDRVLLEGIRGILYRLQDCIDTCINDLDGIEEELTGCNETGEE